MLFRPRIPGLHALDRVCVEAWSELPDAALGEGLSAEQRRTLAGLLAHVWEIEKPSRSFVDDSADSPVVEWLSDFEPAPSYVWARARHPESHVLFWWTLADPNAERRAMRVPDPYANVVGVTLEETEGMIALEFDDGSEDGATVKIKRHSIELFGLDEEPLYLIRAIIAFTGWASARDAHWEDLSEATEFLVGDWLPCEVCGAPYESGMRYRVPCDACGASSEASVDLD